MTVVLTCPLISGLANCTEATYEVMISVVNNLQQDTQDTRNFISVSQIDHRIQ